MTRKNKTKNKSKPVKIKPIQAPPSIGAPPAYSRIDYTNQVPSQPPPNTVFDYAIPKNTEPALQGILKKKLHKSFQMFGKDGDAPLDVPKTEMEILDKLTYPVSEENSEDFLIHRRELVKLLEEEGDETEKLFKKAEDSYVYLESRLTIKFDEHKLYRSYGECPQKEFIMATHNDIHRIYQFISERNANEELKRVMDFVDKLKNKEEIEKFCSTKQSLLNYLATHPSHFLHRELFKSCILVCDLIGITVRSHMPLINEIEDSFAMDDLPRNPRFSAIPNCQSDLIELNRIRQNRDVHLRNVSHSHRIILTKLVEKMPNFLGTAVLEYLEFDENAKKWAHLKKVRETEIETLP